MRVGPPSATSEPLWGDIRTDALGSEDVTTIAIIGGGFSGICLAAHLHRAARRPVRILVFEREKVGAGVAFGTHEPVHLLNGPASNHSPFDDRPDEFTNFLANEPEAQRFLDPAKPIRGQFVPRMLYGRFLRQMAAGLARPSPTGTTVTFVNADIHDVVKRPDQVEIVTDSGTLLRADAAVLAIGHPPPRSLASLVDPRYLIDDPWDARAIGAIPADASVAIVGSGQSAVDLTLGIISNGHRGAVTLLSRRGRIAVPFVAVDRPYLLDADRIPRRLQPFIRWLRSESERFIEEGGNWRGVIDALRPYSQRIWSGFSPAEKRRFFEHMAPFWYLHRSRLPPQAAQRLDELRAMGRVTVVAGRIVGATPNDDDLVLHVRPRGGDGVVEMPAGAVINCTGPWWDLQKPQSPLVAALLASGTIRWDDVGQGIAVTMDGVPLDASGRPAERLFAIGPICRGTLLEIMVVRDIRTQCRALADRLLARENMGVAAGGSLPPAVLGRSVEKKIPSVRQPIDSFRCRRTLIVDGTSYEYFSLAAAEANGLTGLSRLPTSLKVLVENLLRHEDGETVTAEDIRAAGAWCANRSSEREIAFRPTRILMQDFTGTPAMVDLAAMRDAAVRLGADPRRINPVVPVDLVIDHSLVVDRSGTSDALAFNTAKEFERNAERYRFLRWAQSTFENCRVIPPGTGICHQINLEYLAQPVWIDAAAWPPLLHPDTLVGTDSHTTMVNAIGVLGWGVGGIEAEAAMLGQPLSMLLPDVVGVKMSGRLREGVTSTDLALTITQVLRRRGVVNRFVEFFGPWLADSTVEDRATIANMAPEYGATCGFFPVDARTLEFWQATGRDDHRVRLASEYYRAQGMFRGDADADPIFTDVVEFDLASVEPSLAGPKRPHDRVALSDLPRDFVHALEHEYGVTREAWTRRVPIPKTGFDLGHGDVVIAAITSCTNTSNPGVMIAAGLLAKKAIERGLATKPWVKTSLAPGSRVVMDYLAKTWLDEALAQLGFHLVGYGCTTCTGNSGPLLEPIGTAIHAHDLAAVAVISGNRNFEGRVSPDARASYLASPPLVVAYALAGTILIDLSRDPIGTDRNGAPVYLRDIWPSAQEVVDTLRPAISRELFQRRYHDVFDGNQRWRALEVAPTPTYAWQPASTYIRKPPYFADMTERPLAQPKPVADIIDARILGLFLDSITTDHISPVGSIKETSPAGLYLSEHGIVPRDYNAYGARRGNHEVMVRGAYANTRIKNQMVPGVEGGVTVHQPSGERMPIYDAAMRYQAEHVPLIILAGKEYGSGSSRDWAAKGTKLLGVRAVIAESFERIHRSNLVGMGVLPLVLKPGVTWQNLGIIGRETITIRGLREILKPRVELILHIGYPGAGILEVPAICRIDTIDELEYFRHGGILPYVLTRLISADRAQVAANERRATARARK